MSFQAPIEYLRVADAARFIGVHRQTLHRMVREGRIAPVKLGRTTSFRLADLRALMEAGAKEISSGGLAVGLKPAPKSRPLNSQH